LEISLIPRVSVMGIVIADAFARAPALEASNVGALG
jgi:hypothetical protein